MRGRIALVDAYSTGRFLPQALARRGRETVHVQSSPHPPEFFHRFFARADFVENVVHDGELEATAERLAAQGVEIVLAGSEYGVELADRLGERLGLPGNGGVRSSARCNKAHMAAALREAGVRSSASHPARELGDLLAWARMHGSRPIVLKPLDSAGGDGVFFCSGEEEIARAFSLLIGRENAMGRRNDAVLAQEFLEGTEYFVNTVSRDGRHHVAEIWKYTKRTIPGHGSIYDMEEPLPWDGEVQAELRRYIAEVLDALGIRHGPAHSEIMWTARGPVLIETGARLAGSILPHAVARCFGTNHVELTADAVTDSESFHRGCGIPYRLRSNLRYVSLIVPRTTTTPSLRRNWDSLRELPSFFDMHLQLTDDRPLSATIDSRSSPGYVYLIHDDPEQIRRDYDTIRAWEESGLYATL